MIEVKGYMDGGLKRGGGGDCICRAFVQGGVAGHPVNLGPF